MKVLILTASVGEGHNAAARAVTEEIRALYPDCEIQVENGLARVGAFWEKFVIDGYKIQLEKAQWSYSWLYWSIVKSKKVTFFYKGLCSVIGCRKIHALIEEAAPDIVLSTYPLTSAMIASLKRRGKITMPAANLVTDFAPHPMWMYPDLDDNYVMHIATIETVSTMMEPSPTTVVAPLVSSRFLTPSRRPEARAELGVPDDAFVVMVIGGGWGVGNIERSARAVAKADRVYPLIICGRNEALKKKLEDNPPPRAIIRGFVDNMPDLLDASDLAVQNAGGLTSLEALRRGCPVLITDAIPGHGVANGELMDRVGVARYVRDPEDLPKAVAACRDDATLRARAEQLAKGFGELPSAGATLMGLMEGKRSAAALGLPDPFDREHPVTAPGGDGRPARAGANRRVRLSAALVGIVALFLAVTSGSSVSVAASLFDLPAAAHATASPGSGIVLCVRATQASTLAALPDILQSHGATASFFFPPGVVTGDRNLVDALTGVGDIQDGGIGSVSRLSNPIALKQELSKASAQVKSLTGHSTVYYLPAKGSLNPAAWVAAKSAHQEGVVGSVWVHWRQGSAPVLKEGDIVVLDLGSASALKAQLVLGMVLAKAAAAGLHVEDLSSAHVTG